MTEQPPADAAASIDGKPIDAPQRAMSFGEAAQIYDRGRPGYPDAAVEWLMNGPARAVLELGAGTGKLTRSLVAHGHDVFAVDPDEQMLDVLSANLPHVKAAPGSAEQIPAPDRSADVVVAGQAWHWFDHPRALDEIARVLKPGGHLALVWNIRDESIPWVRRLGTLLGERPRAFSDAETITDSRHFGPVEEAEFKHWQDINREIIVDLVNSRSAFLVANKADQEAQRAAVLALYDDYGRGHDGMQLPYRTMCFRARLLDHVHSGFTPDEYAGTNGSADSGTGGDDTDLLLIDFR